MAGTPTRTARWRLALISALALVVVVHHGYSVHQKLWSSSIQGREGFYLDNVPLRPVVKEVPERFRDGLPNPAFQAGVAPGDVVEAIENARGESFPILSGLDLGQAIRTVHWGEPYTVVVSRPGAAGPGSLDIRVAAMDRPSLRPSSYVRLAGLLVLWPLLALGAALLIGFSRPADDNALRASVMFLLFVTFVGIRIETLPAWLVWPALALASFGAALGSYLLMSFALQFPSRSAIDRRAPWLRPALLAATLLLAAAEFVIVGASLASFDWAARLDAAAPRGATAFISAFTFLLCAAMFALALAALATSTLTNTIPAERRRLRLLLAGMLAAFVPLIALLVARVGFSTDWPALVLVVTLTMWIFPLAFVYAVVRHQVFGIRVILRRGLQYTLVTRGVFFIGLAFFTLLYFTLRPWIAGLIPAGGQDLASVATAGVGLGLGIALWEVNRRSVMPAIDRRFFRDAYDARRILSDLADAVRQLAAEPEKLLAVVAEQLHAALHPTGVTVFLRREEAGWLFPGTGVANGHSNGSSGGLAPAADDGCETDFCCALVSPAPRRGAGGPTAPRILQGAELPSSCALSALLDRVGQGAPHTIDVVPATAALGPRKTGSSDYIRLEQLEEERALLEPLQARLLVPMVASRRVVGFLALGAKLSEEPYTREDRHLLLALAGQTATALDYAQLISQTAERERLRRELQIAQEVQGQLFPQQMPRLATLSYAGVSQAARILGGDYFDFLPLGPGRLGVAVADLSGKGIPAALLMAALQGALRSHAPQWGDQLAGLVADINGQLCATSAPNKFATFFYAVYDDDQMTFRYVNAGHNPPLLVRGSGPEVGQVQQLTVGGTIIGAFPGQKYTQETLQLRPGDLFVAYTDGLTDATNSAGDAFGEERLQRLVADNAQLEPEALQEVILGDVARYTFGVPLEDDITLIIARVNAKPQPAAAPDLAHAAAPQPV